MAGICTGYRSEIACSKTTMKASETFAGRHMFNPHWMRQMTAMQNLLNPPWLRQMRAFQDAVNPPWLRQMRALETVLNPPSFRQPRALQAATASRLHETMTLGASAALLTRSMLPGIGRDSV